MLPSSGLGLDCADKGKPLQSCKQDSTESGYCLTTMSQCGLGNGSQEVRVKGKVKKLPCEEPGSCLIQLMASVQSLSFSGPYFPFEK